MRMHTVDVEEARQDDARRWEDVAASDLWLEAEERMR